ncbi:hypothetical protein GGQ88_002390 [Novosphingobium hassiacum]|uniref:DUF1178 family protein n=1 Tax=Novosphingobium hassiacum TaxID=173676 RepID=A0A7W5ZXU8_9SPHN|nr:DUF1178 family protein [Novosphingobium hassiacum]MBB3861118.1 hypothetical protein [Novosphingobium hassiacum]
MIVFDLQCEPLGHRFEGWFGSSQDFEDQRERGLMACPTCGSAEVAKAVMAPNIGRKGNQIVAPAATGGEVVPKAAAPQAAAPQAVANRMPPEVVEMFKAVAAVQAEAIKTSTWVGDKFADDVRAMHYGEKDNAAIHGRASLKEARDLIEEGIQVAPVLCPVVPPEETH